MLIDSASEDGTLKAAEAWLGSSPEAFAEHELVSMEEREGKTAAVKRAIAEIRRSSPNAIVVMVDADATCAPGALQSLIRAMAEEDLGAVGGRPERRGMTALESGHRDLFSWLREAESSLGATPFLEGSLMAFRAELVDPGALDASSNADDAQIAMAVAEGYRPRNIRCSLHDQSPRTVAGRWEQRPSRTGPLLRRKKHVRLPRNLPKLSAPRPPASPFLMLLGWQMHVRWAVSVRAGMMPWETPLASCSPCLKCRMLMLFTGVFERMAKALQEPVDRHRWNDPGLLAQGVAWGSSTPNAEGRQGEGWVQPQQTAVLQ